MNSLLNSLCLLLLLPSSAALAATATEENTMFNAYMDAKKGDQYLDRSLINFAQEQYVSCANALEPLLKANPGLGSEQVPNSNPVRTAKYVSDYCASQVKLYGSLSSPEAQSVQASISSAYSKARAIVLGDAHNDAARAKLLTDCVNVVRSGLKSFPSLADVMITQGDDFTNAEVGQDCAARLVAAQKVVGTTNAAALSELGKLKSTYEGYLKTYGKAAARPGKTDLDVLLKYRDLKSAAYLLADVATKVENTASDSTLPGATKLGSTTVKAFVDATEASRAKAEAAVKAIKPAADRIFDKQYAQLVAAMPKQAGGERLKVFIGHGIPSDWNGGPVFTKYGIYSADGVALAKDISTATKWFYGADSSGCTYIYSFNKNVVVKVEKPLGC
ncbi:hypothetical protein ACFFLM_24845 [Deinococcus oregonensis]|uniref:Uncharacterized protein n=1 Tax=Deinococcus oregonensis TaxID=1805970 RepID=A0ABV6B5Y7_9DEIO